jgi:hypothetical protein
MSKLEIKQLYFLGEEVIVETVKNTYYCLPDFNWSGGAYRMYREIHGDKRDKILFLRISKRDERLVNYPYKIAIEAYTVANHGRPWDKRLIQRLSYTFMDKSYRLLNKIEFFSKIIVGETYE